jgi:predicted lipid-binding transport protein (Tim44 family)
MTTLFSMIIDIIIFAAVAAFFGWKLWSVLGSRTGDERERPTIYSATENDASPLTADGDTDNAVIEGQVRELNTAPANSLAAAVASIRQADHTFEEKQFLAGARTAFTMIVEAFAKGNEEALKGLLKSNVLSGFVSEIERRKAAGETMETRIVRILAADISAARVDGTMAVVTVDFTSEQISVTRNAAGEVIDGNPTKPEHVAESWVFERDITSRDPNWFLVATRLHS